MWNYFVPRIRWADLPSMLLVALCGAIVAGCYGAFHDQLTYAISPEYFTKLKFRQFHYANLGLGDRAFASTVGILATWWVGAAAAWFMARRSIPRQPLRVALRQIGRGMVIMLSCAALSGAMGFGYGLYRGPQADYSNWSWAIREFQIDDAWSFVRVAYIHNAGYLGGLAGLVIALWVGRRSAYSTHSTDQAIEPKTS